MLLELTNPRSRLSRTETRGRPISCLGELCWYLAGSSSRDFISYYVGPYGSPLAGKIVSEAYGPRLVGASGQLKRVIELLRQRKTTRRAVVQIFDSDDLGESDVPCTCVLQFLVRRDLLQLHVYMRSNDAFIGLPHDVFCFTMIQELVARDLGIEVGSYKHYAASLHVYNQDLSKLSPFMNEGFQSTIAMPKMPIGEPWSAVADVLRCEESLRTSESLVPTANLNGLDPYWLDLVQLLRVYRCDKDGDAVSLRALLSQFEWDGYKTYVQSRLDRLENRDSRGRAPR